MDPETTSSVLLEAHKHHYSSTVLHMKAFATGISSLCPNTITGCDLFSSFQFCSRIGMQFRWFKNIGGIHIGYITLNNKYCVRMIEWKKNIISCATIYFVLKDKEYNSSIMTNKIMVASCYFRYFCECAVNIRKFPVCCPLSLFRQCRHFTD